MSGNSSVGTGGIYEDGNQRNAPASETNQAERFKEGQPNSHLANDSKDERSIANKLERESKREKEGEEKDLETQRLHRDPTEVAASHGNEPSKGAKVDKELQDEEEEILKKKGAFGPK